MRSPKRKTLPPAVWVLLVLAGASLLAYPTVSDWWSRRSQAQTLTGYAGAVAALDPAEAERIWAEAEAYNADLWQDPTRYEPGAEDHARYLQTLDVSGTGIMGHVRIPQLEIDLPIYHGSDEDTLQTAVGHIEGSSLPVGGAGTHCVLIGHSGLPSARLFTDLDQMAEGDTFTLEVLGRTLTYQVDQITVVLPQELENLELAEGQDYCTLVTCTPYGVNSHRLLVRGHRTAAASDGEGSRMQPAAPWLLAAGSLAALLIYRLSRRRKTRCQKNISTGNQTLTGEGPQ